MKTTPEGTLPVRGPTPPAPKYRNHGPSPAGDTSSGSDAGIVTGSITGPNVSGDFGY
ncbi:MAG: hypothetical protein AAGJ40_21910 [Planctomycetota bacterium]